MITSVGDTGISGQCCLWWGMASLRVGRSRMSTKVFRLDVISSEQPLNRATQITRRMKEMVNASGRFWES